jgi:hypothetical protein
MVFDDGFDGRDGECSSRRAVEESGDAPSQTEEKRTSRRTTMSQQVNLFSDPPSRQRDRRRAPDGEDTNASVVPFDRARILPAHDAREPEVG